MLNQTTTKETAATAAPAEITINGVRYVRSEELPVYALPLLERLYDCCLGSIVSDLNKNQFLADMYRASISRNPDDRYNDRMWQISDVERTDIEELKILLTDLQYTKP